MKFFLFISFCLAWISTSAGCQTIHWLVFADTHDEHVGHITLNSANSFYRDFIDIVNASLMAEDIRVNIQEVKGDALSPNKCKDAIAELQCGPNDIVVFYYIGCGYNTAENKSLLPLMNMGSLHKEESIPLSWVHESIKKKKPKLLVSIGLCDNLYLSEGRSPEEKYYALNSSVTVRNAEKSISDLFMNYTGDIVIASSSLNQCSSVNTHTGVDYFTGMFVSVFDEMQKAGILDWYSLLGEVSHRVGFITKGNQQPIWKCNLVRVNQNVHECSLPNLRETAAELTVSRFWNNLSQYCKTYDIKYLEEVEKDCYTKGCRVSDSLMIHFAEQMRLKVEASNSYQLGSYMNGFEKARRNGIVLISVRDIKEIYNQNNLCVVSCQVKMKGAINVDLADLFYVREGKITKIVSQDN